MSTTAQATIDRTIDRCRPEDATPISIAIDDLESTAPEFLRDLKYELATERLVPARLTIDVTFDEGSIAVQGTADEIRDAVRTAAFLGAAVLTVRVTDVASEPAARSALDACIERARREGVSLVVDGALTE